MGQGRFEHRVGFVELVEPVEEALHLFVETDCFGRLEVDPLFSYCPRDDLHWPSGVIAPLGDVDFVDATVGGRKQSSVPATETLGGERLVELLGGVEHHFDNSIDAAARLRQASDVEPQLAGD